MPPQIVHLALKVDDIKESLAFYQNVFGFNHTGTRRAGPLKDHMSCWMSDGHIGFTLIQYDTEDAPEAKAAGKRFADHAAHLAVHGVLHLAGHDHVRPKDAKVMLAKEITTRFHSAAAADAAEQDFTNRSKGGVPDDIPEDDD